MLVGARLLTERLICTPRRHAHGWSSFSFSIASAHSRAIPVSDASHAAFASSSAARLDACHASRMIPKPSSPGSTPTECAHFSIWSRSIAGLLWQIIDRYPARFAVRPFAALLVKRVLFAASGRLIALEAQLPRTRVILGIPLFVRILRHSVTLSSWPGINHCSAPSRRGRCKTLRCDDD